MPEAQWMTQRITTWSRLCVRLLLLLACWPVALSAQRRAMTSSDLLAVRTPSDPVIAPDGEQVAFTVSIPSLDADRNLSEIWLIAASGGTARAFITSEGSNYAPRWAPDGKTLAFISARDGSPQIWTRALTAKTPTKVTTRPRGVLDFFWSKDGRYLYLVSETKWPGVQDVDRRAGAYATHARIWTDLFYRHWDEWRSDIRSHLYRLTLNDGRVLDLTPIDHDVPTLALGGGDRDLALSIPGTELALTYNPDSSVATSTNNDIFVMGPDGSSRQPITNNPANDHSPAYSPDGRSIAYLATERPGFESDRQRTMLYERATGRIAPLTQDWDRSVSAIRCQDAGTLLAEVSEDGERRIYTVDARSGKPTLAVGGGASDDVTVSPGGDFFVFVHHSAAAPPELWRAEAGGRGARALTELNRELTAQPNLAPASAFNSTGANRDRVKGWLVKPPGFSERQQYPLVYLIHGGPQGAWADEWNQWWNCQLFAARGYVVAAVNFHGSTGYGQAFTNSVSRNWGGTAADDLLRGVEHLGGLRFVDSTRIGAAVASYGGYMVLWLAGQTGRLKALVDHAGIFNPVSMAGTTDEMWFPQWEFGGTPLSPSARALMEKWSPANFASRWTTPLLVTHGALDYRVDVSEGLQAFTAARLRGLPAKFVYFPNEGHWITRPRNQRLWWGVTLDWLDTWLKEAR